MTTTPSRPLAGKVALVTGSATGIGSEAAIGFAREGADVVVNYSRSEAEAQQTRDACAALGVRALLIQADCSREDEVKEMVDRAARELGGLDILVNNAGRTRFIPFERLGPKALDEITDQDWDAILGLNLKGAFYASRAAAHHMQRRGDGLIVNVSSIAGHTGAGSSLPYAVSKGAMTTMTKALAKALAPAIRVNAVAPGIVTTRWVAGREEHVERYSKETPMGRAATAEDVARVIVSFATHGTFLTGEVTVVDGGREMRS
jgi:3-oxoacyl-[acyl-carrier protein] reductase